jgi:hypothetical protein
MIESFPDCSDCGTYFSIYLRTSVPEQFPGKTVFHQPLLPYTVSSNYRHHPFLSETF